MTTNFDPVIGLYVLGLVALTFVSRHPLQNPKSHGFYRFFAWVGILTLWLIKSMDTPETLYELPVFFPPVLLLSSAVLVILGFGELWRSGRLSREREDITLFQFEKTTELVTSGVFGVLRHPIYLSLTLLTWGLLCQRPTVIGIVISLVATYALYLTACADERECIEYFGEAYSDYIKRTWAFIPFIY